MQCIITDNMGFLIGLQWHVYSNPALQVTSSNNNKTPINDGFLIKTQKNNESHFRWTPNWI